MASVSQEGRRRRDERRFHTENAGWVEGRDAMKGESEDEAAVSVGSGCCGGQNAAAADHDGADGGGENEGGKGGREDDEARKGRGVGGRLGGLVEARVPSAPPRRERSGGHARATGD